MKEISKKHFTGEGTQIISVSINNLSTTSCVELQASVQLYELFTCIVNFAFSVKDDKNSFESMLYFLRLKCSTLTMETQSSFQYQVSVNLLELSAMSTRFLFRYRGLKKRSAVRLENILIKRTTIDSENKTFSKKGCNKWMFVNS